MKKLGFAFAGLVASKDVLSVAVTTVVATVALAPILEFDPWTWVLGAAGGTLAQVFLPSDKVKPKGSVLAWIHGRKLHIAVIAVSIILAGVGSEYLVRIFQDHGWTVPNIHAAAFMLSFGWPFAAHLAWKRLSKWSES